MRWDQKLPGCFGERDLLFANHPLDEQWAFEWLTDLRARQIGWREARQQIRDYLASEGASQEHIDDQLAAAAIKLEPWLGD